ncbi:hypothetical protein FRB95_006192 [Tulasnella sp. JGI-2019a]|nr:hypothetical protein FRB95_006192 [Tulasnella sp. JGI-2019a]
MVNPSAARKNSEEQKRKASTSFSSLHYKFACASIRALKKNKNAGPFLVPVDWATLGIPHYLTVIERPMDFGTIERKLFATVPAETQPLDDDSTSVATRYWSVDEWIADVHLVFQNSFVFNGPDHPISIMATALQLAFEKQLKKLPTGEEALTLNISRQDSFAGSSGPKSAGMFDDPSSREQSQAATPFSRTSLELPPVASRSSSINPPSAEDLKLQQLAFCRKLLDHLHKPDFQHFAWFFYNPVLETDVPGYFNVIDKPMSLAVMRERLNSGEYSSADAFRADFDQMIWNCNKFNPPGSAAQVSGKQLKDVFLKKWKALPGSGKKTGINTASKTIASKTSGATPSVKATPPAGGRLSLPSAQPGSLETSLRDSPADISPPVAALSLPPPPPSVPQLVTPVLPSKPSQPSSSGLLPSHLPNPSLSVPSASTTSLSKRKSDIFREDDLNLTTTTIAIVEEQIDTEDAFDHRDHARLARAIHKLTGAKLERAISMIKEGLSGVAPIANETGDTEYEVASLPEPLLRALHEAFVPRRIKRRAAKRLKTAETTAA